jgi:hypothetical protein
MLFAKCFHPKMALDTLVGVGSALNSSPIPPFWDGFRFDVVNNYRTKNDMKAIVECW